MSTHTNENDPAMPMAIPLEHLECLYGLTAREHAAIHLRVPMSGNSWLDAMITEARRWDAAVQCIPFNDPESCLEDANALTRMMKGGAQ